jgi:hypothetical protein
MFKNLVKLALLIGAMAFIAILFGGVATTSADSPQAAPPTVVLPTPVKVRPTPTKAPAAPTGRGARGAFSYSAGFQVQNLSTSTANITITYYNQDGTVNTAPTDTIGASSSKTYYPIHPAASFNGSVVLSSDQPVVAVVNVLGSGGNGAGAAYDAATQGGTTASLPLLMKGNYGYNTWFNVQNTGTTDASVSVTYSDGTTAGPHTVKPGAARTYDQSTETHSAAVFSASVSGGGQPIAAAVIEENTTTMFAYSGFAGGATNPVMPLVNANNYGYVTGIQIMNIGGSATDVTVSYTPSTAGAACTETQNVPAGQSKTFALNAFTYTPQTPGTTCALGATFVGSARVTTNSASQNLVAIVNQVLTTGANGEAYNGFNPTSATNKVLLPLIMDRNYGWLTGFNVMNVGTGSTTVTCTFTGTSYTASGTLAAGAALTDVQDGKIASGYVGSATCTASSSGDKIVGVVNEVNVSGVGDQLLVYEGFNQ